MRITTKHTLRFTISSSNPPHDAAVAFIRAACARAATPCLIASVPMPEGALDSRSSEVTIESEDLSYLNQLSHDLATCMLLIGVEVYEDAPQEVAG